MRARLRSAITTYVSARNLSDLFIYTTAQIDNFSPTSTTVPTIATHIAVYLKAPDIMFLQEIQDNDGSKDDGVVDANVTLTNLIQHTHAYTSPIFRALT